MNEQDRAEVERLKLRQARLDAEMSQLAVLIKRLDERLAAESAPQPDAPVTATPSAAEVPLRPEPQPQRVELASQPALPVAPTAPATHAAPMAVPPILTASPLMARNSVPASAVSPHTISSAKPVLPVHQETASGAPTAPTAQGAASTPEASAAAGIAHPEAGIPVHPGLKLQTPVGTHSGAGTPPIPPRVPMQAGAPARAPQGKGSFEMRLGRYWLVRIGVVLVLTAMVFSANLAYQNVIRFMGPGVKVSLLYLASGLLLGAGAWWQRKAVKESLRNYAQVLFAGGLAAVYFTTYAAYHVPALAVISSALLDGLLLFAWAGFMAWIADRKKSEVLALFAVGLAYYTSVITHAGLFTLYSNLLLTATAVFFLVRNHWVTLSAASLAATYGAYAFWRFFDGSNWYWPTPENGLWTGVCFLISYWLVFTAAVFLSRHEKLKGANRAAFLTLNNGAFFTGFVLTMLQVREGHFWVFALVYGGVLLVLSELARRFLKDEPEANRSYLTQGLLLATVGIITHYAGMQLALLLAVESVILLTAGLYQRNIVLLIGAYLSALLSTAWGMDAMWSPGGPSIWLGAGLGALMIVNAALTHRASDNKAGSGLRARVTYFTVLALAIWFSVTWNNTARADFPLILAAEAVLLTASIYVLRVREIAYLSQGFMVLAQLAWGLTTMGREGEQVWWKPALLIVLSLGLSHWWQRQKAIPMLTNMPVGQAFQGVYALAIVGILYGWVIPHCSPPVWLAVACVLAIAMTAYGVATRAWMLALCGQIYVAVGVLQFVVQLSQAHPPGGLLLAPVAALMVLSLSTVYWFRLHAENNSRVQDPLLQLAVIYRWVALGMSLWWVCEYIPVRERVWVFGLLGAATFALSGWFRNREALLFSTVYSAMSLVLFWIPLLEGSTYFPNLLFIAALLAQAQVARKFSDRYKLTLEVHGTVVLFGGASLWLFLTRLLLQNEHVSYLTAGWSVLALVLFLVGILLRERAYRWVGLGILALALGRVVIVDIWKFELVYRVLSLAALGTVLLVLGFLYNKYQEKLKEWL